MKKILLTLYILLLHVFLGAQDPFKVIDVTYVDIFHDYSMDSNGNVMEAVSFASLMGAYYLYAIISIRDEFYFQHPDLDFNLKREYKYNAFEPHGLDTANANTNFYLCSKKTSDTVAMHCCNKTVKKHEETIVRISTELHDDMLPFNSKFLLKNFRRGLSMIEKRLIKNLEILYWDEKSSNFINIKIPHIKLLIDKNSLKHEFMTTFCK